MTLRISGLAKSFGGAKALDGVDLTVPAGQVHALLGHNGAGKSTLIKCLGGAYAPDAGTIEVSGAVHTRLSPRESIAAGVAIIFQTLSVVEPLTVAENIFLGQEWTRRSRLGAVDRRAQEQVAAGLLERVAASCSPRDRVGDLPMGQRQLVEIAKALSRSAAVLVLDEPTAALSSTESDALAARVEDLRTQGLAIVYVTHLLSEVERLADALTVLRDGRVSYHSSMSGHTRRQLVDTIAGATAAPAAAGSPADASVGAAPTSPDSAFGAPTSPVSTVSLASSTSSASAAPKADPAASAAVSVGSAVSAGVDAAPAGEAPRPGAVVGGPPVLAVDALTGPGFGPVDVGVAGGEIVGLYGLIGSGRTRLLETLFGRRPRTGGTVRVADRAVVTRSPAEALAAGIALVPGDRRAQGVFAGLSAQDNALLPTVSALARWGVRSRRDERRVFADLAGSVGLRPFAPRLPAAAYSGGNQQKLVLGRWVNASRTPSVLLLDEPTQGVDVGSRQEIYRVINRLAAERRTAVLFASSDPEEIVALAHRCLVVAGGRVVGELAGAELTEEALLSAVHESPAGGESAEQLRTDPCPDARADTHATGSAEGAAP
ncbi:sugar ABC transporter ATP-binding protein [Streptomyces sp. NPDC050704]|uniref:sugar ABC transporter ATP-binding protein n=1 Tax=Streptomyces sp. NPDC050704 TaxID=3157219 RepID=UPI00343E3FBB